MRVSDAIHVSTVASASALTMDRSVNVETVITKETSVREVSVYTRKMVTTV